MNRWLGQYIESEKMYYLTEHDDEIGVVGEYFFDTLCEYKKFIKEHKINVHYASIQQEQKNQDGSC
jgi:hypothetical protein